MSEKGRKSQRVKNEGNDKVWERKGMRKNEKEKEEEWERKGMRERDRNWLRGW